MVRNKNQIENERQPHHVGENFGFVPSPGKRTGNMHTAEEGLLLSTGFTIRMEGKMMKFSLQKIGYRHSPFFVDVLKRIQKNGRGESFMMIRIGNIIHCVLVNA